MWYRRAQVILLALIATLSLVPGFPPVRAEAYTLTVSPSRTQETNSPGVTLSLGVTGASVPLTYTFEWIVLDPSGNTKNAIKSSVAGQSSFELSVVYPQDFGGSAAIAYVGTYAVNVAQTTPVFDPQVAVGTFDAGLTDQTSYQRTSSVSIKATSFSPNEDVTVDISRGGSPAPGFPRNVVADAGGNLAYAWQTGASTLTGTYTVTLTGTITSPKTPADSQTFGIVAAVMNVAVSVPNATLEPGDVLALSAIVTYPDGTILSQGSVTAVLSAAARPLGNQVSLLYDPNQGKWTGGYTVGGSDPAGVWVVQVSASDPYGNSGQSSVSALEDILPTPTPEQNPLTSFWFLTVMGVVGAGALGFLVFKRKRIVRHQLMVDLQAVDREADRVKNQDFFKSIQDQLNRKRSDPKETGNG